MAITVWVSYAGFQGRYIRLPEGKCRVTLIKAASTKIERHIKIRGAANPFDPKDAEYFRKRKAEQQRRRAGRVARKAA